MWIGYCERIKDTEIARLIKEYDSLPQNSPEAMHALDAIAENAAITKTYNDWRNVYFRAPEGSIIERIALLQMSTHAKTFGQWLCVYQESLRRDDCADISGPALTQLQKLADQPTDVEAKKREALRLPRWIKILQICPRGGWIETLAKHRVAQEILADKAVEESTQSDTSPSKI